MRSICYHGFLGGPRSMGRVGEYFLSHLLKSQRYRVSFCPFKNDYMAPRWSDTTRQLLNLHPSPETVDQMVTFCSVLDARKPRRARQMTPWMFYELTNLPKPVVEAINTNDAVYVCSQFVRDVFVSSGVHVAIEVLGHGVNPSQYRFKTRSVSSPFTFLCVAEHTPRKNLPMLVRCFERAFGHRDDVELLIKVGLHGPGGLAHHITQPSKVKVLHQLWPDDRAMASLYHSAHCFVLPTRAEGFGMPFLEAMATGLPVIATDFSGHLDFCTPENAYLIRNRGLVDADTECFPHIPSQWADPDEDHLIELLCKVVADYDAALLKAVKAQQVVQRDWTWSAQLGRVF